MENDKAGYNIVVKDFNDNGDRLSLKEKKSNPIFRWNYTITNSTIKRDGVDDVVVEGSRVDNTLPSTIQTKLTEGMNSPNGNDWFIPR